jgi:hypothetical protein
MRDVKDVEALLDSRFRGAGRSPWSLLRIMVWVAVGLVLIGMAYPVPGPKLSDNKYNAKIKDPLARIVTLDENDPRGFRATKEDRNDFTIAWVGPSTLQSISPTRYGFIPADVRDRIPRIDGRKVVVDIYFMSGGRVVDMYAATEAALKSDADMIVIDLNPLWLFNDRAIQAWENLNGTTAVHLIGHPSQWDLVAELYSPSDVVLGLASTHLPSIRNRWSYAAEIRRHVHVFDRLDVAHPPPATKAPSELDRIALMQEPIEFWTRYRHSVPASASIRDRQAAFLEQSDVSGGTVNDVVVDHLLAAVAHSGLPAYLYVPPLAPDAMTDPTISATLAGIERHLGEIAARHRSPLVEVNNESLGRVLPPTSFNDLAHVKDDGPIVTYLTRAICHQLLVTSTASQCSPLPKEATR